MILTRRALPALGLCCCLLVSAVACGRDNRNTTPPPAPDVDMAHGVDKAPDLDMGDLEDRDKDFAQPDAEMGPPAESIQIEGLSAPVQVTFDSSHVPHIRCESDEDCFAAQGYYHAAHRFTQMDLRRRVGAGKLATLLLVATPQVIALDVSSRQALSTRDGEPLEEVVYERLGEEEKAALEAYTRGVNAWLGDYRAKRNGAQLSEEGSFVLIDVRTIPDWRPQDSVVVSLLFLNQMMNITDNELAAGRRLADFNEEQMGLFKDFLYGWHVDPDSVVMDSAGEPFTELNPRALLGRGAPQLEALAPRMRRAAPVLEQARARLSPLAQYTAAHNPFGSNSWATAPGKNAAGHALLANDPHLPLSNPALWYLVEMDARTSGGGDLHAAGVSFPGLPGVLIGYSEDVAWSATIAYWDLADVYIETLNADGDGVMRDGEEIEFIRKTQTFGKAPATQDRELLYVPGHGPVIALDEDEGTAVTLKNVLADVELDFKLFFGLGSTRSLEEAKDLLKGSTAAGFNFVLIDRQGSIAYYPFAAVPRREWDLSANPPWLPLDGSGVAEWSAPYIQGTELPHLLNPPNDFIVTANAAITSDMLDGVPGNAGYPPLQSVFMAGGERQGRIVDQLQDSDAHDLVSYKALQGDSFSWLAQHTLPEILRASEGITLSPEATAMREALGGWDYTCPTGLSDARDPKNSEKASGAQASASIGCAIFHTLYFVLTYQTFIDEVPEGSGIDPSYEHRAMYWLLNDPSKLHGDEALNYWDNKRTEEVIEVQADGVARALEATVAQLEVLFGSGVVDDWRWGRIHTLTLNADLLSTQTPMYNHGPFAAPGGLYTVNAASPNGVREGGQGSYAYNSGASMRMIIEGKPEGFTAHFNFPGGQVHRRDSAYYDHLLDGWLANEYFVMPFTQQEIEADAQQVISLTAPE